MRPMLIIGGSIAALALTGVLLWTRFAPAQVPDQPQPVVTGEVMTITAGKIEVRSGPGLNFYATSNLVSGDRVEVVKSDKAPPGSGWLAIKPPEGSRSWINAKFVELSKSNPNQGHIVTAEDAPVDVKPASSVTDVEPTVVSFKLKRGTQVTILGKELMRPNDAWLPIQPPAGDVRFIQESAVSKNPPNVLQPVSATTTGGSSGFVIPPGGDQSPLGQGEDFAVKARQQFQLAAQSNDPNVKVWANRWLQALAQAPYGQNPAVQPGAASSQSQGIRVGLGGSSGASGQLVGGTNTVLSPAATPTGPAQWTQWGTLRKTTLPPKDGQAIYRLEDSKGAPLGYAVAAPGLTLEPYVNRMVVLWGPTAYRSDDYMRGNYTIVSQLDVR